MSAGCILTSVCLCPFVKKSSFFFFVISCWQMSSSSWVLSGVPPQSGLLARSFAFLQGQTAWSPVSLPAAVSRSFCGSNSWSFSSRFFPSSRSVVCFFSFPLGADVDWGLGGGGPSVKLQTVRADVCHVKPPVLILLLSPHLQDVLPGY